MASDKKVYLTSADWNDIDYRIEMATPLLDPHDAGYHRLFSDTVKARSKTH